MVSTPQTDASEGAGESDTRKARMPLDEHAHLTEILEPPQEYLAPFLGGQHVAPPVLSRRARAQHGGCLR